MALETSSAFGTFCYLKKKKKGRKEIATSDNYDFYCYNTSILKYLILIKISGDVRFIMPLQGCYNL